MSHVEVKSTPKFDNTKNTKFDKEFIVLEGNIKGVQFKFQKNVGAIKTHKIFTKNKKKALGPPFLLSYFYRKKSTKGKKAVGLPSECFRRPKYHDDVSTYRICPDKKSWNEPQSWVRILY